jgi:hypothetical protein
VGAFRDDDYALHADPNSGWHVLAVADGAGSAQYSRRGSQLAVQTSVPFVAQQLASSPRFDGCYGGAPCPPGNPMQLQEGQQILLTREEGVRLAFVQMVDS